MLYYKTLIELVGPKTVKKLDFFSLGEVFIGIGMGLGGGEMWDKHFGNMQHPRGHNEIFCQNIKK